MVWCVRSSSMIATAAGIMMLVAAELLIHMLRKAVTVIRPAILLRSRIDQSEIRSSAGKKKEPIPFDRRADQTQNEQCQTPMQLNVFHRLSQGHASNEPRGDVLLIRHGQPSTIEETYFEIIVTDPISRQDTCQGEEGQRKQRCHRVGHRFRHPIDRQDQHDVGASRLLDSKRRTVETKNPCEHPLTMVRTTSGKGKRISGVRTMISNRHHCFKRLNRWKTTVMMKRKETIFSGSTFPYIDDRAKNEKRTNQYE